MIQPAAREVVLLGQIEAIFHAAKPLDDYRTLLYRETHAQTVLSRSDTYAGLIHARIG